MKVIEPGVVAAVAVAEAIGEDGGRVAGQVGDRQVVATDIEVDVLEQPGHRPHQERAHPRCPQVFDRRDELALAERAGPGVQALGDVLAGQLVEGRCGLGAKHQRDRLHGYLVGKLDRHEREAQLAEDVQFLALGGGAVVASST